MKLPSKQHISITAVISVLTAIIVFLLTQIWNYGVEWKAEVDIDRQKLAIMDSQKTYVEAQARKMQNLEEKLKEIEIQTSVMDRLITKYLLSSSSGVSLNSTTVSDGAEFEPEEDLKILEELKQFEIKTFEDYKEDLIFDHEQMQQMQQQMLPQETRK